MLYKYKHVYLSHICMAGMYKLMDKWNIDAICNEKMCLKNLDSIRMLQIAFKFPEMINMVNSLRWRIVQFGQCQLMTWHEILIIAGKQQSKAW